jgi:hypothetical protein
MMRVALANGDFSLGLISDIMARGKIQAEGKEMARQFALRVSKERIGEAKHVAAEFNILAGHAVGFRRKTNLGVIGTSQLVNSFQWSLIEEGWNKDFAKDIGNQLAVKLAGAAAAK